MRFATRSNGSRDGEVCFVSRDLVWVAPVALGKGTLQSLVDEWESLGSALETAYTAFLKQVEQNAPSLLPFSGQKWLAPLPRAYQWLDGSAYVNHVELVRKARGAEMPTQFWTDPLMYQGCSDAFIGPNEPILMSDEAWGIDFESEVAVMTTDVPMGIDRVGALKKIIGVTLVNDVSLRNLIPAELAKGFGFLQSKPASSFAPVVATLDELAPYWVDGKLHLRLRTELNGHLVGEPDAGQDMTFDFGTLISHAAKTRRLAAGTLLGSGTVSNVDRSSGSSCLAEKRMLEVLEFGAPRTEFLRFGDRVRIDMLDENGRSIFGAIDQTVVKY